MSKRKKSFGSAPATHKRRAEVEAAVARRSAQHIRRNLADGDCRAAFYALTGLNMRWGRVSANAMGYKKRNALSSGLSGVRTALNEKFRKKRVR